MKEQRIIHRVSCPHTLAQNGIVERKYRHLVEIALSLLKHVSLLNTLWDEVVCTSAYLINRMPTPLLHYNLPYNVLYNQRPDYVFLRNFGCLCYPYTCHYATNKLNSRSKRCMFFGYSAFHQGYRCLSLSTGRIYISWDVIFYENIFPYATNADPTRGIVNLDNGIMGSYLISSSSPISHCPSLPILSNPFNSIHTTKSIILPKSPITTVDPEPSDHPFSPPLTPSGHIPSPNPLLPSNIDHKSSPSRVKTKPLIDIIESIATTNFVKYPLPHCLNVITSKCVEPSHFTHTSKQP